MSLVEKFKAGTEDVYIQSVFLLAKRIRSMTPLARLQNSKSHFGNDNQPQTDVNKTEVNKTSNETTAGKRDKPE